ncbi:MAG: response regulator [Candidatus Omnitrophota bacterium]|nr:response regulator [Candidatus Omnitrophota bacterium]
MKDITKILIIDDEVDICEMLKDFFSARGYQVMYALTGQGGLDAFNIERPQIVMLDLFLGDIYGLEVLKKIKRIDRSSVVIIITGSGSKEDEKKAKELGADFYLDKPFSVAALKKLLLEIIKDERS